MFLECSPVGSVCSAMTLIWSAYSRLSCPSTWSKSRSNVKSVDYVLSFPCFACVTCACICRWVEVSCSGVKHCIWYISTMSSRKSSILWYALCLSHVLNATDLREISGTDKSHSFVMITKNHREV